MRTVHKLPELSYMEKEKEEMGGTGRKNNHQSDNDEFKNNFDDELCMIALRSTCKWTGSVLKPIFVYSTTIHYQTERVLPIWIIIHCLV